MSSIRKKRFSACCLMLLLIAVAGHTQAAVLDVPLDYPTIQSAIDAAVVGVDSVRVHNGTYYENLDLWKSIRVSSVNGPGVTFINGSRPKNPNHGSVVMIASAIGGAPTLVGFTLTGGSGHLTQTGGDWHGGGVYSSTDGAAKIINCVITGNSARDHAGGVWASGKLTIASSIIENNTADLEAGIAAMRGPVVISNSTIRNNTAAGYAGGIGFIGCTACELTDSVVVGNTADDAGKGWSAGGIQLSGTSSVKVINSVIDHNTAGVGGGIYVHHPAELSVTNSTIRNNSATYTANPALQGGGIFSYSKTPPTVVNSILWGNSPQQIQIYGTPITVRYSNVQGKWEGEGNIGKDPGFKAPMDYHLLKGSPCIDKGTSDSGLYPTIPDSDIDGDERPQGAGIDMGADEFTGVNSNPTVGSLTPSQKTSSAGIGQTFTAVYNDAEGYIDLKSVDFLVSPTGSGANAIWARYVAATNELRLYDNAGTKLLAAKCTPGVAGMLQNTQGKINCGTTTVTRSGKNLTVKWKIIPKAAFAGAATPKKMKMKATDNSGATSDWRVKGSWLINP